MVNDVIIESEWCNLEGTNIQTKELVTKSSNSDYEFLMHLREQYFSLRKHKDTRRKALDYLYFYSDLEGNVFDHLSIASLEDIPYNYDRYVIPLFHHPKLPFVTGINEWGIAPETPKGNKVTKKAQFPNVLNHPIHLQQPQYQYVGNFGNGKSQLNNLVAKFKMGQGFRALQIGDRRNEFRNLIEYGYFDNKLQFHPFRFTVWFPEGFEPRPPRNLARKGIDGWYKAQPLFDRTNVCKAFYTDVEQIVDALEGYKHPKGREWGGSHNMQIVFLDAYYKIGKIHILAEIMAECATMENNPEDGQFPVFIQLHEGSEVLPMAAKGGMWEHIMTVADLFLGARKDDICVSFETQSKNEIFYRVGEKATYRFYFAPTAESTTKAQKYAESYLPGQCNIAYGNRWVRHSFLPSQEVADVYRIIPPRDLFPYPLNKKTMKLWNTMDGHQKRLAVTRSIDEYGWTQEYTAEFWDVTQATISRIYKTAKELDY